jgi:AraC-like DNA-binding protein
MSARFRLSRLLAPRLQELSVSPEAVLRHAGLPVGLLHEEQIFVSTEQLFAFWRAIAEISGNPAIGLVLGSETRIERYDPISIATLCASSFHDACERAARYKQLTCPEEIRTVARGSDRAIQFHWSLADEAEPAVLVDLCFAWMLTIGRRGTGYPLSPRVLELTRAPRHRDLYESHFGCPVKFRADRNAIVFRRADLERPFLTHNADLLAMIGPQIEAEIAGRRAGEPASDQVKSVLKRLLAGRRPDLREVSRELGLSTRTLQRRLGDAGVTYQQVLEEARRELARHYLLHSELDLSQTAYLLGYEDANSFFRAFHHWEGSSPGRWRDRYRKGRAPLPSAAAASSVSASAS